MVLNPSLSQEEIVRHQQLIKEYFAEVRSARTVDIEFYDNGNEKGVYKVHVGNEHYMAAAAARKRERLLLEEYNVLHELWENAPEFFPRPISHYRPKCIEVLGDLIIMELLPHLNLKRADRHVYHGEGGFYRTLAYELGKAAAVIHAKTGRFSSDPNDGNILVKPTYDSLDLRFCDAIQFIPGTLEEAAGAYLVDRNTRPESYRFIRRFREGLIDGMMATQDISRETAWESTEFVRRYNDVF